MKKTPLLKKYQMGVPNLTPQGTQKIIMDNNATKPKKFDGGVSAILGTVASNPELMKSLAPMLSKLGMGDISSIAGLAGGGGAGGMMGGMGGGMPGGQQMGQLMQMTGKLIGSGIDRLQDKRDARTGKYNNLYGRPYKKGSKLIKYQEGNESLKVSPLQKRILNDLDENANREFSKVEPIAPKRSNIKFSEDIVLNQSPKMMDNISIEDFNKTANMLPEDLLSRKDRMISKLPKSLQRTFAGKAKSRIDRFERDYNEAKSDLKYGDDLSELDENRITRKILSNRKNRPTSGEIEALASREGYTPEPYADIFARDKKRTPESLLKEIQLYKTRDAAEEARKAYEAEQKGTPLPDNIKKEVTSTKVAGNISFKDMTPAQQKQYRAGIASGRNFTVEGIKGSYKGVAKKKQQTQPNKNVSKVVKNTAPLIKSITPQAKMTGNELVLMSRMGKPFNPYQMAGFTTPFNKPKKEVAEKPKTQKTKTDNRRVYPEESPLAKYRKGIPSKPATSVPTRVMDYKTQNLLASQRGELAKNLANYKMASPFNPNGSVNLYTPLFEMGHNARFGKKK